MATTRNQVVLAKIETTNGTDATPAAADAIQLEGMPEPSVDFETIERELANGSYVNGLPIIVARKASLSFSVRLRGSGTAATAPKWMRLLQAGGFTVAVDTDHVDATPNPSNEDSITVYLYRAGVLHKYIGGGVSDLEIAFDGGWKLNGVITAKHTAETAAAAPGSYTFDSGVYANGLAPSFTYKSQTPKLRSFSLALGAMLAEINDINNACGYDHFHVNGFAPNGTLGIFADPIGTFDWRALAYATLPSATEAASFAWGSGAGNQVALSMPNCRLGTPSEGAEGAAPTLEFPFYPTDSAAEANDWLTVTTQ